MSEDMIEKIYGISKEYDVKNITVMTNHLKFSGTLCECGEKKDDDCVLTISDAKIWRLEDYCTCKEPDCKCNETNFCAVDWLHINLSKIVAFTLQK